MRRFLQADSDDEVAVVAKISKKKQKKKGLFSIAYQILLFYLCTHGNQVVSTTALYDSDDEPPPRFSDTNAFELGDRCYFIYLRTFARSY